MRTALRLCSIGMFAAVAAIGCGHDKTVMHRETLQTTVPAPPVIEERRTTTVEPLPPTIEERTTVKSSHEEHRSTVDEY